MQLAATDDCIRSAGQPRGGKVNDFFFGDLQDTMKQTVGIIMFLPCALAAVLSAQDAAQAIYAQSFRQGATQITEQNFEARLDPQNRDYTERVKDSRGNDRYVLTIAPVGPEGDTKITSWQVKLSDLHHAIYENILLSTQEPSLDATNNLWRLDPAKYAPVSIRAQRIIKVDSFYVVLQVKAYHFTPIDSPYLDSMTVQVKFSNTDPRGSR
jgi:hypothetical protein